MGSASDRHDEGMRLCTAEETATIPPGAHAVLVGEGRDALRDLLASVRDTLESADPANGRFVGTIAVVVKRDKLLDVERAYRHPVIKALARSLGVF